MRAGIILLLIVVALVGLGLAGSSDPLAAEFRFTGSGSIVTLDPAAISWVQDIRIAGLLYEGLYTSDPQTLQPVPAAAEWFDIDATQREYTFHLRPGARWSNGDALTAGDFVFAWRRAIEPGTAEDYAFFIEEIQGIPSYMQWRAMESQRIASLPASQRPAAVEAHLAQADTKFAAEVALRAIDPVTLWMRLRRPIAYWLDVVSFPVTYPLHAATVSRFRKVSDNGLIQYDPQWTKPGNTAYNGPFLLARWRFKRGIRLDRNPYYWDRERIKLNTVAYIDTTESTAWPMYESGVLDWLPSNESSFAPALAAQSNSPVPGAIRAPGGTRDDIHPMPMFGTFFFNINCLPTLRDGRPNPFADPRVRRAFALSLDRQSVVANVTRRGEPAVTSFVPWDVIPGYTHVEGLPWSVDRARAELAAAGYSDGRGFPPVELLYNTDGEGGRLADTTAQMWRTALGVDVRLVGKETQSFGDDKKRQHFMLCRASWYGDYLDPMSFLETLRTGNGNNDSGFSDPRYDAMLDAADATLDPFERLRRLADCERYIVSEALPIIPVFRFVHVSSFDPKRIRNFHLGPRMVMSLKDVSVVWEASR